ncbi:hypothetical protein [Salmonella phage SP154]|nr:hypothetical protein [Salmonella phage SP154]
MKLIVAGGRDFTNMSRMDAEIKTLVLNGTLPDNAELVCGMARGADATARNLWKTYYGLPVHEFPADWDKHGKAAGFIRNTEMAEFADFLVAFWDGSSRGTAHMIATMQHLRKPYIIINY